MGSAPSTRCSECRLLATGRIHNIAIARDGTRIVSGGEGCESRVWDGTGTVTTVIGDSVKSCAFSRDGTRLLTGGWDNCARLWDAASGALERTFEGHGKAVRDCDIYPTFTKEKPSTAPSSITPPSLGPTWVLSGGSWTGPPS